MESGILLAIVGLVAAAVGGGVGYLMRQRVVVDPVKTADVASAQLRSEAETRAKEILLQAQDEAVRLRTTAEEEHRGRRAEIQRQEKRLQQKEENLDRKLEDLDQRERALQAREREIDARERQADELRVAQTQRARAALRPDDGRGPRGDRRRGRAGRAGCLRPPGARAGAGGGRAGRALGAADHRHGDPALLQRPGQRVDRLGGPHPERGDEGPDHRARGAQHPRAGGGDRHRPDRGRHAGRGDAVRVRPGPPRDRPAGADQAGHGRANPPGPDRRDRGQGEAGGRGAHPPGGRDGSVRGRGPRPPPGSRQDDGEDALPHQLRPEPATALRSRWRTWPR